MHDHKDNSSRLPLQGARPQDKALESNDPLTCGETPCYDSSHAHGQVVISQTTSDDLYWNDLPEPTLDHFSDQSTGNNTGHPMPQIEEPAAKSTIPDRKARQKASKTSGKVVYVIFGGENPGLYYNWDACEAALARGVEPRPYYRGYTTYIDGERAAARFFDEGMVDYIESNRGHGARPSPPPSPVRQNTCVTTPTRTRAGHTLSARSTPTSPLAFARSRDPRSARLPNHSIAKAHQPAQVSAPPAANDFAESGPFYVVTRGYRPGVYNNLHEAQQAAGALSNSPYITVGTRAEANQVFVDAFMAGRVQLP